MTRSNWITAAVMIAILAAWAALAGSAGAASKTKRVENRETGEPLPGSALSKCLKSGRPTMADFGRGWCKPCKMMVPVLSRAAKEYRGKANIVFVELGEYGNLGRQHRIIAMPTQVFFDARGKEVARHMGYMGNGDIDFQFARMKVKK